MIVHQHLLHGNITFYEQTRLLEGRVQNSGHSNLDFWARAQISRHELELVTYQVLHIGPADSREPKTHREIRFHSKACRSVIADKFLHVERQNVPGELRLDGVRM